MISVVITAYNYGKYIKEAIESALNQTYKDIEVIVIDDGSTDNTEEICNAYPVRYIKQNNRGLPSARNTGIMNAKGEYILFLDADDKISPLYLEDALPLMENADIVYCNLQHYGDRDDKARMSPVITKEIFLQFNPISYCSLIRKSCLLECGGYNVKMIHGHEDYDLWVELFIRGKRFVHLDYYYFYYHKHGSSMIDSSYNHPDIMKFCAEQMKRNHKEFYE